LKSDIFQKYHCFNILIQIPAEVENSTSPKLFQQKQGEMLVFGKALWLKRRVNKERLKKAHGKHREAANAVAL
jgi:hypothetical protein